MSQAISSLFVRVGADTDEFERKMRGVSGSLDGIGRTLGGIATLGAGAVVAAGAGLSAFIMGGINKAMDFEQAIADIDAALDLTFEQRDQVAGLINQLSVDPDLVASWQDVAAVVDSLGRNGAPVQAIIDGLARSTVLLANATNADFATAADIVTDVTTLWGLSLQEADAAVDQITGTLIASKFGVEDYRLALAQAGGVASASGVDFDDFNAVIAAISPSFASGSDAGTSFKTFLQRLVPQSDAAYDAMAALGLITEDGKNKFFDAEGQLKSMNEVAGILTGAFTGLSDEQLIAAGSTIFGTDSMRAAFALAQTGVGDIDKLKATIGDTSAEEQAATRTDTLASRWDQLKETIDQLQRKVGEKFLPTVEKIVEWAKNLVGKHQPEIEAFFETMAEKVTDTVDAVIKNWPEIEQTIRDVWEEVSEVTTDAWDLFKGFVQWFDDDESSMGIVEWFKTLGARFEYIGASVKTFVLMFQTAKEAVEALVRGDMGGFMQKINKVQEIFAFLNRQRNDFDWVQQQIQQLSQGNTSVLPQFASGGTMQRTGWALVGERGPEIVHLGGGSRVYSNTESQRMAQGNGGIHIHGDIKIMGGSNGITNLASTVSLLNAMYG